MFHNHLGGWDSEKVERPEESKAVLWEKSFQLAALSVLLWERHFCCMVKGALHGRVRGLPQRTQVPKQLSSTSAANCSAVSDRSRGFVVAAERLRRWQIFTRWAIVAPALPWLQLEDSMSSSDDQSDTVPSSPLEAPLMPSLLLSLESA